MGQAIRAERMFDGEREIAGKPCVVIEDVKIVDVGSPEGLPVVDLGDVTLLPGLVDSIEHGLFLAPDGLAVDWSTVDMMVRKEIYISTTTAHRPSPQPATPVSLQLRENFGRMRELGVRLVCSSDGVGSFKRFDSLPHGIIEFGALLGFSPADALASATSVAAQACGI